MFKRKPTKIQLTSKDLYELQIDSEEYRTFNKYKIQASPLFNKDKLKKSLNDVLTPSSKKKQTPNNNNNDNDNNNNNKIEKNGNNEFKQEQVQVSYINSPNIFRKNISDFSKNLFFKNNEQSFNRNYVIDPDRIEEETEEIEEEEEEENISTDDIGIGN